MKVIIMAVYYMYNDTRIPLLAKQIITSYLQSIIKILRAVNCSFTLDLHFTPGTHDVKQ